MNATEGERRKAQGKSLRAKVKAEAKADEK